MLINKMLFLFGADTKDLKKGIDEGEKGAEDLTEAMKKADEQSKKTSNNFAKGAKGAKGWLAAVAAASKTMGMAVSRAGEIEALDTLSLKMGASITQTDALARSIVELGGSTDQAQADLGALADALKESGQEPLEGMLEISDQLAGMSYDRATRELKEYGITEKSTIELMRKGSDEIQRMIKHQEENGAITQEAADKAKKTSSKFAKFAKGALGWLAAAAAAGKAMSMAVSRAGDIEALDTLSLKMGASITQTDALARSIVGLGGSTDQAQADLNSLADSMRERNIKPMEGMLKLADQLAGMNYDQATKTLKNYGITERSTAELLRKGSGEVRRMMLEQEKNGAITQEAAEKAKAFNQSLSNLKRVSSDAANSFAQFLMPVLTKVIDFLAKAGKWAVENKTFVIAFFAGVAGIVTTLFLPAMLAAAAATIAATWPFIAIGAAIGAAAAMFALIYDDIMNFIDGNDSLIGQILNYFPVIGEIINFVVEVIKIAFAAAGAAADALWGGFKAMADGIVGIFEWLWGAIKAYIGFITDIVGKVADVVGSITGWFKDKLGIATEEKVTREVEDVYTGGDDSVSPSSRMSGVDFVDGDGFSGRRIDNTYSNDNSRSDATYNNDNSRSESTYSNDNSRSDATYNNDNSRSDATYNSDNSVGGSVYNNDNRRNNSSVKNSESIVEGSVYNNDARRINGNTHNDNRRNNSNSYIDDNSVANSAYHSDNRRNNSVYNNDNSRAINSAYNNDNSRAINSAYHNDNRSNAAYSNYNRHISSAYNTDNSRSDSIYNNDNSRAINEIINNTNIAKNYTEQAQQQPSNAMTSNAINNQRTNNIESNLTIGQVTVETQATDAAGVSEGLSDSLSAELEKMQANNATPITR